MGQITPIIINIGKANQNFLKKFNYMIFKDFTKLYYFFLCNQLLDH